jgi:hypothetical protein
MEHQSKREKKRDSSKKSKEFSIYSQKAVRAKEALWGAKDSCPVITKIKSPP